MPRPLRQCAAESLSATPESLPPLQRKLKQRMGCHGACPELVEGARCFCETRESQTPRPDHTYFPPQSPDDSPPAAATPHLPPSRPAKRRSLPAPDRHRPVLPWTS